MPGRELHLGSQNALNHDILPTLTKEIFAILEFNQCFRVFE